MLCPRYVAALALGDLSVRSHLGEPFVGDLAVRLDVGERLDARCIRLTRLPPADQGSGIRALTDARLTVKRQGATWARVMLRTQAPVNEPIVGLNVTVACGDAAVSRVYTALLDPLLPTPLEPALKRAVHRRPPGRRSPNHSGRAQWRVHRGETLSRIAATLVPGDARAQAHLIRAIVAANPAIFPAGDPNRLPAGSLLQLPAVKGAAPTPGPAKAAVGAPTELRKPSYRLKIVTRGAESRSGAPRGAAEAPVAAQTRRLLVTTESEYADTEALKARLQRLDRQVAMLEKALATLNRVTANATVAAARSAPAPSTAANGRTAPDPLVATPVAQRPLVVGAAARPPGAPARRTTYGWWLAAALGCLGIAVLIRTQRQRVPYRPLRASASRYEDTALSYAHGTSPSFAPTTSLEGREGVLASDPFTARTPPRPIRAQDADQREPASEAGMVLQDLEFRERASASFSEVHNILVRAEFYLLLKQPENAIRLLRDSLEVSEELYCEPSLWLMLLRVYRQELLREEFEHLQSQFRGLFNIEVPSWDDTDASGLLSTEGNFSQLESRFPRILSRITRLWATPGCAAVLHGLLLDDRDGTRRGFDMDVAEEILMLKGVLRLRKEG